MHSHSSKDTINDKVNAIHYMNLARDEKNPNKAIEYYTKVIGFNPNDPLAYEERGRLLLQELRFEEALSDYNQALKLDKKIVSQSARFYSDMGFIYENLKRYPEALLDYLIAYSICPTDSSILNHIKRILYQHQHNKNFFNFVFIQKIEYHMIYFLIPAIVSFPEEDKKFFLSSLFDKETAFGNLFIPERGKNHLELFKENKELAPIFLQYANYCCNEKKFDEAIDACTIALKHLPDSAKAYYIRGSARYHKMHSKAKDNPTLEVYLDIDSDLKNAFKLNPSDPSCLFMLGCLWFLSAKKNKNNFDHADIALEYFNKAIELDLNDGKYKQFYPQIYLCRAVIFYEFNSDATQAFDSIILALYNNSKEEAAINYLKFLVCKATLSINLMQVDTLKKHSFLTSLIPLNIPDIEYLFSLGILFPSIDLMKAMTCFLRALQLILDTNEPSPYLVDILQRMSNVKPFWELMSTHQSITKEILFNAICLLTPREQSDIFQLCLDEKKAISHYFKSSFLSFEKNYQKEIKKKLAELEQQAKVDHPSTASAPAPVISKEIKPEKEKEKGKEKESEEKTPKKSPLAAFSAIFSHLSFNDPVPTQAITQQVREEKEKEKEKEKETENTDEQRTSEQFQKTSSLFSFAHFFQTPLRRPELQDEKNDDTFNQSGIGNKDL